MRRLCTYVLGVLISSRLGTDIFKTAAQMPIRQSQSQSAKAKARSGKRRITLTQYLRSMGLSYGRIS